MSGSAPDLRRESEVFTRHLLGVEPTAYVTERYLHAHSLRGDLKVQSSFDRLVLAVAARGPFRTRICDAYARLIDPRGLLRRKLALLLAILESSPEVFRLVDLVDGEARPLLALRLVARLASWLFALVVGLGMLLPLHAWSRLRGRDR